MLLISGYSVRICMKSWRPSSLLLCWNHSWWVYSSKLLIVWSDLIEHFFASTTTLQPWSPFLWPTWLCSSLVCVHRCHHTFHNYSISLQEHSAGTNYVIYAKSKALQRKKNPTAAAHRRRGKQLMDGIVLVNISLLVKGYTKSNMDGFLDYTFSKLSAPPSNPQTGPFFTSLYGLYPCNFLKFLHKPYAYFEENKFDIPEEFDEETFRTRTIVSDPLRRIFITRWRVTNLIIGTSLTAYVTSKLGDHGYGEWIDRPIKVDENGTTRCDSANYEFGFDQCGITCGIQHRQGAKTRTTRGFAWWIRVGSHRECIRRRSAVYPSSSSSWRRKTITWWTTHSHSASRPWQRFIDDPWQEIQQGYQEHFGYASSIEERHWSINRRWCMGTLFAQRVSMLWDDENQHFKFIKDAGLESFASPSPSTSTSPVIADPITLTVSAATADELRANHGNASETSLASSNISPETRLLIAALKREVLLLRNELNFELFVKQQHLQHMGRLHREHMVDSSVEAERQRTVSNVIEIMW